MRVAAVELPSFPDREFKVWDYAVSHKQMVIRSLGPEEGSPNLDLHFRGVEFVCAPTVFRGLAVVPPTDQEVAEFLILDHRLPRSIMHGLDAAFTSLRNVRGSEQLTHSGDDDALRMLGRLRARIRYADIAYLMENLGAEMTQIQDICDAVTAAITTDFFAAAEQPSWVREKIL